MAGLASTVALAALAVSPGVSGASGSSQLQIGMVQAFSGPTAPFGPEMAAGCVPAANAINKAGGVLGHKISCKTSDNRGDPADAVPAAEQLIAATSNLVGVLGPTSNCASATVPLFNRAHVPLFTDTGQSVFTKNHFKYYYRITPPDAATGYAMALYAWDHGYRKAAAVFGTDISAQGSRGSVVQGFKALGGKVVLDQAIAENQTSYRSEVAALAAAKPQVVFTEATAQTSATYWSDLKQDSHLVPIIGTDGTTNPTWSGTVSKALGKATFKKYYVGVHAYAPTSGPAYGPFKHAVIAAKSQIEKPIQPWLSNSYVMADYDGVNIIALAMLEAKSTNPVDFNKYIPKVTAPSKHAVVVHSFAEGKKKLAKGKKIRYEGATGAIKFNKWHNSYGDYEVVASNLTTVKKTFTGAKVETVQAKASKKG